MARASKSMKNERLKRVLMGGPLQRAMSKEQKINSLRKDISFLRGVSASLDAVHMDSRLIVDNRIVEDIKKGRIVPAGNRKAIMKKIKLADETGAEVDLEIDAREHFRRLNRFCGGLFDIKGVVEGVIRSKARQIEKLQK